MATPSASPPSSRTTAPSQATSASADAKTVTAIATGYEEALWSGDPATAWALLAPGPFRPETYAAFARTAAPWRTSPYRRFVVSPATNDPAALATWIDASLAADLALRADRSRAYVVFVQHPDVVGASAGGETLVVAPLVAGDWRIWRAH